MYTAVYSSSYISDHFVMVFHRKIHIILQKATNAVLIVLKFMI